MPFLRFSRDKRGYEHIYLVHAPERRGKPTRPRVLYWYRSPPGIRVGRKPFDEEVRHRLEAQNPGVTFDWNTIVATPFPPISENEQWRERRRAERAAKQAQRSEEGVVVHESQTAEDVDTEGDLLAVADPVSEAEQDLDSELGPPLDLLAEVPNSGADSEPAPQPAVSADATQNPANSSTDLPPGATESQGLRRKRRRRGGRRRRRHAPQGAPGASIGAPANEPPAPGSDESVSADSGDEFAESDDE